MTNQSDENRTGERGVDAPNPALTTNDIRAVDMADNRVSKHYPYFKFYTADWLTGTASLSAAEKGVFITLLAKMYENNGPIKRDDGRLARECGLPKAGFIRAVEQLIELNKITFDGANLYSDRVNCVVTERVDICITKTQNINSRWEKTKQKQSSKNTDVLREPYESGSKKIRKNTYTETDTDTDTLSNERVTRARRAVGSANKFDEFWSAWPNKVGKPVAAKSYAKVAGEHDAIIAGVFRYIENKPPDRSWLNPSTFLNNRRWEDEPAPVFVGDTAKPKRNSAITEAILSLEFEDGQSETHTDGDYSLVQQVPFLIEHEQG